MKQKRPYILLNFAVSIDGKIASAQRTRLRFSSRADWDRMDEIRASADAVLIGARTIRAEDPPVRIRRRKRRERRKSKGLPGHPLSIILSRSLDLPYEGRYFSDRRAAKLVVTTHDAPPERLERVRQHAEVLQTGKKNVDISAMCEILSARGISRLLVEGGGEINMAFLAAGCVDEIYMTVCPVIIGGRNAPTPADGAGFDPAALPLWELIDMKRVSDEIFLHYRMAGTRRDDD